MLRALLWPRTRKELARLHAEVRAINRRMDELLKPTLTQAEQNAFAVRILQGQLTTIGTKVDAAVERLNELVSDAYTDGLAARNMRDWVEPPTRPISPQVNGLRLNGRG